MFFPRLPMLAMIWLLVLWVLWAALLFGGLILGKPREGRRMPRWTRLGSSLALTVAGWSWALVVADGSVGRYALCIAVGMTFGLLGDVFLAQLLPVHPRVVWGMAGFGLGHVAYVLAALGLARTTYPAALQRLPFTWGFWLLVGLAGWYLLAYRRQPLTALRLMALPYALLLASTPGVATALALAAPPLALLALGGVLFLASDLLLAGDLFGSIHLAGVHDVIWLTYGPGQMLIVYSVGVALSA